MVSNTLILAPLKKRIQNKKKIGDADLFREDEA
jgi:hypothetical protein